MFFPLIVSAEKRSLEIWLECTVQIAPCMKPALCNSAQSKMTTNITNSFISSVLRQTVLKWRKH